MAENKAELNTERSANIPAPQQRRTLIEQIRNDFVRNCVGKTPEEFEAYKAQRLEAIERAKNHVAAEKTVLTSSLFAAAAANHEASTSTNAATNIAKP